MFGYQLCIYNAINICVNLYASTSNRLTWELLHVLITNRQFRGLRGLEDAAEDGRRGAGGGGRSVGSVGRFPHWIPRLLPIYIAYIVIVS